MSSASARLVLTDVCAAQSTAVVELRGLAAGSFDSASWKRNTLHWVPDTRSPILAPRPGKFRNIYAPSVISRTGYWDIFYGAWDGVDTPNDRIYHTTTTDFLQFGERHTIIEHGEFEHTCNVSAVPDGAGAALLCTGYPDANGRNKPLFLRIPVDALSPATPPRSARQSDVISLSGYPHYANADINGMNVLFAARHGYAMYFSDFRSFGHIYRATSVEGTSYTLGNEALSAHLVPNDVKCFTDRSGERTWLMGLHMNQPRTWFALSADGLHFEPQGEMFSSLGESDRHIVAVGFVTDGAGTESDPTRTVLGVLYGAGAAPTLDKNRIFARWLQKRVVVERAAQKTEPLEAFGPDRQLLSTAAGECTLSLYGEDGTTRIDSGTANLQPGRAYQLSVED